MLSFTPGLFSPLAKRFGWRQFDKRLGGTQNLSGPCGEESLTQTEHGLIGHPTHSSLPVPTEPFLLFGIFLRQLLISPYGCFRKILLQADYVCLMVTGYQVFPWFHIKLTALNQEGILVSLTFWRRISFFKF
jgi:hypothetical protein